MVKWTKAASLRAMDGLLLVSIGALWFTGAMSVLLAFDPYFLAAGILAVGAIFYTLGHWTIEHHKLGADTCISLGLAGTLVGFILTTNAGAAADMVERLLGFATAISTTLAGAFAGLLLRYQAHLQGDRS